MARRAFDTRDLAVFDALALVATDGGGAIAADIRVAHPGPLPIQCLAGMARRGLLFHEVFGDEYSTWIPTVRGLSLAEQFRAARLSSKGGDHA